ncbi:ATP-binding protein [Cryobacterium luteum]|uniref:Transcriptional regulator n=1 Tax=Cryobacterium luteum TaxID=1424661 RepID=A0A1H8HBW4_9MICO|nr:ATP-binding protein [Cryobacterium luteum]TFB86724.1 transcriptional regulator [Cryobacterium luteum]SEN53327.1 ATP-dependent DNA helicase RecG [Cryobacterium luteum]
MKTSQGSLREVISSIRRAGTDLRQIEVKAAVRELPKSLWPTVSAFSNHGGGLIILGLSEENGFNPAEGFDAARIRDSISDAFRPRGPFEPAGPISPRPVGAIDIVDVDGAQVVIVDVAELPPGSKPSYVTNQGVEAGTYERVGDGDRRMSTYAIFLLTSDRGQPRDDSALVAGSTITDLDPALVDKFIARLRRTRARSIADLTATADILQRHNVIGTGGVLTRAGLLTLGRYPQQYFPQLMITFAAYPGRTKADVVGDIRMLDRQVVEGPIPVMVDDAVRAVLSNLKVRRVSRGAGAADEPEIPVDAVREAIANALTHRDYSDFALGDQVRVEIYPDRLEVWSPGGIWGGRRVVDLFDGSSRSRNQVLASLLTEVPFPDRDETVCENAGSGILRMAGVLGGMGLPAPRFTATSTSMTVTLDRHGLLTPEMSSWLSGIGAASLNPDAQRTLVLVHRGYDVEDQLLRAQFGMDSTDARLILRALVADGWLRFPSQPGGAYRPGPGLLDAELNENTLFSDVVVPPTQHPEGSLDERILKAIGQNDELSINELVTITQSSTNSLRPRLRVLIEQGALVPTAPPQSRNRRYRRPPGE